MTDGNVSLEGLEDDWVMIFLHALNLYLTVHSAGFRRQGWRGGHTGGRAVGALHIRPGNVIGEGGRDVVPGILHPAELPPVGVPAVHVGHRDLGGRRGEGWKG